jgi:predicted nucleic acid-binding protein
LVELVRHRALKNSVRSEIHRLLAAEEQIFCPDLKDWKLSAYIVGELRNQNQHMNKVALRKMQMDALIAALAIRHKLTLVSADSDFELIRRTRAGRILRIFQIAS